PPAGCPPIAPCCSISSRASACAASQAGRWTPSSAWTRPSTGACARGISRSRAPTSGACSSSTPRAIPTPCTPISRGGGTSSPAPGKRRVAPEADVFAALAHQPQAVELLRHAVASDHVAHAYAFVGPAGSGRKAAAQAFAAALVTRGGASTGGPADPTG